MSQQKKKNIGVRTVESNMRQKELANCPLFHSIPTDGFSNVRTVNQINVHDMERGEECLWWVIDEFGMSGYAILKDHQ